MSVELTKTGIQNLLENSDKAVLRAIVVIWNLQTADEQANHTTSNSNGVGFSYRDADFGSSLAEKIQKGYSMSDKQISAGRRMVKKYWRQLIDVAKAKQGV